MRSNSITNSNTFFATFIRPIVSLFSKKNAVLASSRHELVASEYTQQIKFLFKSILLMMNKFFHPLFLYLAKATMPAIEMPADRQGRKRSDFSKNKTASIALSDSMDDVHRIDLSKKNVTCKPSLILSSISASKNQSEKFAASTTLHDQSIFKKLAFLQKQQQATSDALKVDEIILKKVNMVEKQIKEHAARRVDLFFYLLVAVYGKYAIVTKDCTIKQHGKGRKECGTQACHSSMLPNIKLEPINTAWSFWTLFRSSQQNLNLSDTQFAETLNMTVELPEIVNGFDGSLEGRAKQSPYTREALEILNKASKKEIDPKEGMNAFIKLINQFFINYEKKHFLKRNCKMPKATKKVWEYEKIGSFLSANEDNETMSEDYFYLMLSLNPAEIDKVKKNPDCLSIFYKRTQDEIFKNKAIPKGASLMRP